MSEYWSSFVSELDPYVPGEQPTECDIIKLNTNENPYPPSPAVIAAIKNSAEASLQLYPDPESVTLRNAIAAYHSDNVKLTRSNVFVGNGSDEVLAHAFNALFRKDKPLLFPDITYGFYPVYCKLYDISYELVGLGDTFEIPARFGDASQPVAGGIVLANPNAPTGILLGLKEIENILRVNSGAVVLVDEAYIDFADDEKAASAVNLVDRYPNLLVVRTLSKSRSLAGLRVGYALGQPNLIEGLNRVKNSFNSFPVDCLAQAAVVASIEDEAYFQEKRRAVIEQRNYLMTELKKLGFNSLPSSANFIMTTHSKMRAEELAQQLRQQKIIVRYFSKPRLENFLRITVGNEEQNKALVEVLKVIT